MTKLLQVRGPDEQKEVMSPNKLVRYLLHQPAQRSTSPHCPSVHYITPRSEPFLAVELGQDTVLGKGVWQQKSQ